VISIPRKQPNLDFERRKNEMAKLVMCYQLREHEFESCGAVWTGLCHSTLLQFTRLYEQVDPITDSGV